MWSGVSRLAECDKPIKAVFEKAILLGARAKAALESRPT
jgi:hypothetical protein